MVGRARVSRGGDRRGNRKRRPLGLLVALVMVASLAMPAGVASAAIGASGNPLTTAAPDLRTVSVQNVAAEIARFCFDQPVANFLGNAGDFRLAGYNSSIQTTGTSIGDVSGQASCVDVEFATAPVDISQYTVGTVRPGAVSNASNSNVNVEGAAALTNISLGPGGLGGRTTGPDLTGATVAGNDVLFAFDEKLLPASCDATKFAMWDNVDPAPNRTMGVLCSVDPGTSTARVTFASTTNAARFVALQAAVTDPAGEPNPIGVSPLTGITCQPGSTNCTADLTAVSRVSDVNVDFTFDKGDPTVPHATTCDNTKFFVFEEDTAPYGATLCTVQSSTANSTVVRATFSTANFSAFETPTAAVLAAAIGGGGGLISTEGARQLGTSREASGFTDAPDLENAEFDTGFNRVTFDFDENVLDSSVNNASLCLVNADDVEDCSGMKVATNGDKVVMQFDPPEVNTAVGALVKDTALTDVPGNASLLASVGRGPAPSAGTIQFSSPTFTVNENGGTANITVTRSGGSSGPASVTCSTSNGTATNADYSNVSPTLSWSDGDSSTKSCNVPITDDALAEGSETVNLSLSGATGASLGSPSAATLTIVDNDSGGSFSFSAGTYAIGEAAGTASITVNRTGGSSGTATVQYQTSNGTATAGSDYVASSGTLTFGNGVTTQSFNVPITNDVLVEGNETVNLSLFNPSGGSLTNPSAAVLTIVDDDTSTPGVLSLASASQTITESAGSQTVTVNRTGGSTGAVSVNYATSNGTAIAGEDYTATSGTLTFAASETTKTFSVPILNDGADESAESFNVTLSSPTGGATLGNPSTGVVTITDDDLPAPGVIDSEISLRYSNRRDAFKGRVIIPAPGTTEIRNVCRDDREIVLRKLNGGGRRTAFTGPLGKFSILKPRPGNAGWFAIVKATGPRTLSDGSQVTCARGESSVVFT